MREIIKTSREEESAVVCCRDFFSDHLPSMRENLLHGGGIVFTDSNVFSLYGGQIEEALSGVPVFVMEAGEENKNERTLFSLLSAMAEGGLRRNSTLVALGGGVVGDIGGLAASLYMRGISCIQVPTTLLAQVDSSVGGKTAIDFCGVKNLVGAFFQPKTVYADPALFHTLPKRELRCGLGEIVKHGVLCPSIFDRLWENRHNLFDLEFLSSIVPENIAFKADVVRKDPHENGLRKCLNLGHTTAHAVELSGIPLSHGECVLVGLLYEAHLAKTVTAVDEEFIDKLTYLCEQALEGDVRHYDVALAARLALYDKKNTEKDFVTCTLPTGWGSYQIKEFPSDVYKRELMRIRGRI